MPWLRNHLGRLTACTLSVFMHKCIYMHMYIHTIAYVDSGNYDRKYNLKRDLTTVCFLAKYAKWLP